MKTVIILGNARSGTSMLSGVVHHLGIDMNPVDNPSSQNPKGSFEDLGFIHVTSQLHQNSSLENKKKLDDLVSKRMKEGKDWGFKSALTHIVFDHFNLDLFEDPYFVFNYRNDHDNAKSWRLHMKENYGREIHMAKALGNISEGNQILTKVYSKLCHKYKTHVMSHESLKRNSKKTIVDLASFLKVEVSEDVSKNLDSFIMGDYSTIEAISI